MKALKIGFFALLMAIGAIGIIRLRERTARQRARVDELLRENRELIRLRDENMRLQTRQARTAEENARADAEEAKVVHAELVDARRTAAALATRAAQRPAPEAGANGRPWVIDPNNRNPEKGPTHPDNFANVGQATPSAALQTAVWAALKGEETILRGVVTLDDAGRKMAEDMLGRLPPEARVKYPTPESLAALACADDALSSLSQNIAVQILGFTMVDATHAAVGVCSGPGDAGRELPVELGAGGWRLVIPERTIDRLRKRMSELAAEPTAKK